MVDVNSLFDGLENGQQQAAQTAISDLDVNPDEAARADTISRGTGVSPGVVLADPEGFERERKAQLTGELVKGNPFIANYVQSHPMGSKVSNDDYDNLDFFSGKVQHFQSDPLSKAWEGFKEGWGSEPLGSQSGIGQDMAKYPGLTAYLQRLSPSIGMGMGVLATELDALGRLPGAVITGAARGAGQLARQFGMSDTSAGQIERDLMTYALGKGGEFGEAIPEVHAKFGDPIAIAKPYIERGEVPPTGLHPDIDAVKAMGAKLDAKSLDEALKAAQASKTRERAPEAFQAFVDSHIQDRKISVSADAIRQLYGDKRPEAEDGILGWVPRINEQLELAEQFGGDVEVPLSDWLAKVDPEVAKTLHEDIRVRKGGMTLREADQVNDFAMIDAWHGTRHGGIEGFKDEAIGTGEGAQAYGWGHYVAESKGVAETYKRAGSTLSETEQHAMDALAEVEGDQDQAHENLMNRANKVMDQLEAEAKMQNLPVDELVARSNWAADTADHAHAFMDAAALIKQGWEKPHEGNLYRVRVNAEPEEFLHWDKPFREQPPQVQEALRKRLFTKEPTTADMGRGGESLYAMLSTSLGGKKAASEALKAEGVKGIRYLDASSRNLKTRAEIDARLKGIEDDFDYISKMLKDPDLGTADIGVYKGQIMDLEEERERLQNAKSSEEATHNLVVFDPSQIEITHENDIARARAEAHLKPLIDMEARGKVELSFSHRDKYGMDHHDIMLDGEKVGVAHIGAEEQVKPPSAKGPKSLYIDWVGGADTDPGAPWRLGHVGSKEMLTQIANAYPDRKWAVAYRVTGAREQARLERGGKEEAGAGFVKVDLDKFRKRMAGADKETKDFMSAMGLSEAGPRGEPLLPKSAAEGYQRLAQAIEKPINDIIRRLAPGVEARGYQSVTVGGERVRGAITINPKTLQAVIGWAADVTNPEVTGRHEVIHFLKQTGMISPREWDILEETASREDWITKHDIDKRYEGSSLQLKLEEAVADEFANWDGGAHVAGGAFDRIKEFLKQVWNEVRNALGIKEGATAEEIFQKIESGEVGTRPQTGIPKGQVFKMADEPKKLFEKGALREAMTQDQYNRYLKAIDKLKQEDFKREVARAEKRQTKEWKANEKEVRDEVTQQIQNRPDLLADDMLGKAKGGFKLDIAKVPEKLRKDLEPYIAKSGVDPDAVSGMFGYTSGEAMMNNLAILQGARKKMPKADYEAKLIDQAVEREMERRYGDFDEAVLQDAREHITSDAQSDLLAQEVQILAVQAGVQNPPLSRAQLQTWVRDKVDFAPITAARDMEGFLQMAGKAGRSGELALLKGDPAEAFRQKQRQQLAFEAAKAAKAYSKEFDKFQKLVKRFAAREVTGVGQEYTNYIHQIMMAVRQRVRRSVQDLQGEIGSRSLQDFVTQKLGEFKEVAVWDQLFDPNFSTPIEKLQAWEFQAVSDSLHSLAHNGRLETKIFKGQNAAELADVATKAVQELETFSTKVRPLAKRPLRDTGSWILAAHMKMEQLFDRWDRDNPKAIFNSYGFRALSESKNHEYGLEKEVGARLGALKDYGRDLNKVVENTVFKDPMTGELYQGFTRKNLRAVMLNLGNESNIAKLAAGYGIDNAQLIWDFVHKHATRGDWDYVQGIWDTFAHLKDQSDAMYRRLSGIAPESIENRPVDTPFKQYKGGYYPLVYDPVRSDIKQRVERDPLAKDGYFRATPAKGYTIRRTGYVAPIDLNLDAMPAKLKQIIHDIAFREALINAQKLLDHRDVRSAITKHFGPDYSDLINPWIKDIAFHRAQTDAIGKRFAEWSGWLRQNVVTSLIGFNPGTIFKHGPTAFLNSLAEVGPKNFLDAVQSLTGTMGRADSSWNFAMDNSLELRHRMRNYMETIAAGHEATMRSTRPETIREGLSVARDKFIQAGSWGVGWSDLLSATPTWLAAYKKAMAEGETHADSVYIADKSVRRAHGSVGITDRARVQRGGEAMQWIASLYGFFNHILNRQVDMVWKAGDALGKLKEGDTQGALADVPQLTSKLFYYVIFPAVVEEMVTPLSNDKHESWAKLAGKALVKQVSASWIGARDLVQALVSGQDPSTSLLGPAYKSVTDIAKDLEAKKLSAKPHWFQHAITALGMLSGIGSSQLGRWGQFAVDYSQGKQRGPKDIPQAYQVLRYGTTKRRTK